MNKIPLYIADEEATKFIVFQQYYEPFMLLVEHDVFSIKNGNATLNFNKYGELVAIHRADVLYSKRHLDTR